MVMLVRGAACKEKLSQMERDYLGQFHTVLRKYILKNMICMKCNFFSTLFYNIFSLINMFIF